MKQIYILITIFLIGAITLSCNSQDEALFSSVRISPMANDSISISKLQGVVRLVNINTKQEVISSDFNGTTLNLQLLKGAYQVHFEGSAKYQSINGDVGVNKVRGYEDFVDLTNDDNSVQLSLIFIE